MYIKTSELRYLDVINVEDGSYLGNVCDVDVDPESGELRAIVVDKPGRPWFFIFRRKDDMEIPWREVLLVGVDVILVKSRQFKTSTHPSWR